MVKPRRLRIEPLEPRLTLSADWPADVGFAADLFIDGGAGLSSRRLYAADSLGLTADQLLTSSTSRTRSAIAGNAADENGALLYPDGQPRYRAIFVNGGRASTHGRRLGATGRDRIHDAVLAGMSYSGSCAGAYLIRDTYYGLDLWAGSMGHNSGRKGYMSVTFPDLDHPFTQILIDRAGTNTIRNIAHYYGPVFKETYRHPAGTDFLGTIYYASSALYRSRGTPYLIDYKPTDAAGRIVVQPSHPEYYRSGSKLHLMEAEILYALTGAQSIPDLKGTLPVNEFTTMDAPTEKVGDDQYHRWTIDVAPGTEQLTIALEGNAQLFVQPGAPAHAGAYSHAGDYVTIADPAAGTWHVSVHGNHDIRNGTPYRLGVSDGGLDISPPPPPIRFAEDFSSGLPSANWEYYSTGDGRISVVGGRLRLDDATRGGYSLNEAILHLNLKWQSGLHLSVQQYRIRDETHRLPDRFIGHHHGDGVSISADGQTWYSLPLRNGAWSIDLDAAVVAAGITYTPDFQIKFQQYDNYPARSDGREFDNIRVE